MTDPADRDRLADIARRLGNPKWTRNTEALRNPIVRFMFRAARIDLSEVDELHQTVSRDMIALDRAASILGPLGWAVSGHLLTPTDYAAAVEAWERDRTAGAVDAVMTPPWRDEHTLRRAYGPMSPLAGMDAPDGVYDIMFARQRLLDRAVRYHLSGDYEASILIVLSQVDGLVYDWNDRGTAKGSGFFPGAKGETFEDDRTIAGMSPVLRTVRSILNRDVDRSTLDATFSRHGITHGRVLGYGTEANSAKSFAFLAAVIMWLRGKRDAARESRIEDDATGS